MTDYIAPDPGPTATAILDAPHWLARDLGTLASLAGEGGNFADLQASGLKPRQAFFVVWMRLYETDKRKLKTLGLPENKVALSGKLKLSRPTLDKWQASEWYTQTGVPNLVRQEFNSLILKAVARLDRNLDDDSGAVANGAIKMTWEMWRAINGHEMAGMAVQVNNIISPAPAVNKALEKVYGNHGD